MHGACVMAAVFFCLVAVCKLLLLLLFAHLVARNSVALVMQVISILPV